MTDLFEARAEDLASRSAPLATRMRPRRLSEVVGQPKLLGGGAAFRHIVESGEPVSMLLWGPPGTGKTTLASLVANHADAAFRTLSATSAGVKDIREVLAEARQRLATEERRTVLFLDEIHRFAKNQQDALLPGVEDGTLMGWTLDLGSARKLGMESTGSAARSPSAPPTPVVTNLDLTPGAETRDDLLEAMGTGLLVTSMIGSSVNATTGDYSRGASGFWVANGEIAYPVNECTVAGNLRDMLLTIRPANDARPWVSRRIPSLLVDGMTIAGA